MKQFLRRVEGAVRGAAETTRALFDPPLPSDAEPLEIREAIIDDVEQHVEPIDSGRRVLPFNHVSVVVLAAHKTERARLEATLADINDAVRTRLGEIQCAPPAGFDVEVRYIKQPRPEWTPDQRIAIDYDSRQPHQPAAERGGDLPSLTITVIRGQAAEPCYTLSTPRVCIGRTPKPVDARGRPRLNHVVFVEGADEHSRTVGRAHASIQYDPERGEYRLFDDGSHNGTRVIRNGTQIDVVPRDPTGVTLRSGDEIEFGTAAVRVSVQRKS